jgi:Domain of unknown function (DUF4440)
MLLQPQGDTIMKTSLPALMRWITLGLLLSVCGCTRDPSEQALLKAVGALQQSVEDRDMDVMEELLAEDFVGPDGLDRIGARRIAAVSALQHERIGVTLGPLDVQVKGRHATVRFTAALTGGSGRVLPDSAQAYDVETGWRFDDGQWRVTSATWHPKF